jgi:transporter family protein
MIAKVQFWGRAIGAGASSAVADDCWWNRYDRHGTRNLFSKGRNIMADEIAAKPGWLWFALGSAAFAAATTLLGKIGVGEMSSNLATFIRVVVMLIATAGLLTARNEWSGLGAVSPRTLLIVIASGLATGLSWLCYFRALQLAPASRVAPLDKLSVALVIIFAIAFLGEPLTWKVAVGGVLIVAGVMLVALG